PPAAPGLDERAPELLAGAVGHGRRALAALDAGRPDEAAARVARMRAVLADLDAGLDRRGGPVGRHLAAIYGYLTRRLSAPEPDRGAILEVVTDIQTLAESWAGLTERRAAELTAA
ncbi:MAG TPA: flagellar protein FliS, partial [Miltoncostaeaceae bacterium]|nr:flagellar protein FliS [Miltoncostaeaceae bacterium]